MNFAFLFPVKIVFAERNLTHNTFSFNQYTIAEFINKNVYFSQDKQTIVAKHSEVNSYFIQIGECFIYLCAAENKERVIEKLTNAGEERISKYYSETLNKLNNPAQYEQEGIERLARIKKEREEADAEQQRVKEERARNKEIAFLATRNKYNGGEYISFEDFEEWCNRLAIKFPIKTLGWARKTIIEISSNGYRGRGQHNSKSFQQIWREFSEKMLTE